MLSLCEHPFLSGKDRWALYKHAELDDMSREELLAWVRREKWRVPTRRVQKEIDKKLAILEAPETGRHKAWGTRNDLGEDFSGELGGFGHWLISSHRPGADHEQVGGALTIQRVVRGWMTRRHWLAKSKKDVKAQTAKKLVKT